MASDLTYVRDILLDEAANAPPDTLLLDVVVVPPHPPLEGPLLEVFIRMKNMSAILQRIKNPDVRTNSELVRRAVNLGSMLEGLAHDVLRGA